MTLKLKQCIYMLLFFSVLQIFTPADNIYIYIYI